MCFHPTRIQDEISGSGLLEFGNFISQKKSNFLIKNYLLYSEMLSYISHFSDGLILYTEKKDLQVSKLPKCIFFFLSVYSESFVLVRSLTLAHLLTEGAELCGSHGIISTLYCVMLCDIGVCKGGTRKTLIANSLQLSNTDQHQIN